MMGDRDRSLRGSNKQSRPSLIQKLAVLYYCLSFGYFTWIWVLLIFLCVRFPVLVLPTLLWTAFIFSEAGVAPTQTASWPTPFKRWILWNYMRDYFPSVKLIKTADLKPDSPYIFACHPHDCRTLTLSLNFRAPFLREYLLLLGACDVSKSSCLSILNRGKSVVIVVGGAAESLHAKRGTHRLVLRRRKGFVKIALQTGTPLVPCYSFGETDTYYTINEKPENSKMRRILERWQRKSVEILKFAMPLAFGTGVIFPHGLLPLPVPIAVVVGEPLEIPKYEGDEESAEFRALVDKYHALYVKKLRALFDAHKEKYASQGEYAELEIVE